MRHVGERTPAPHRGDRRRSLLRPIDADRGDQSRSRDHLPADGFRTGGAALDGSVGELRPRHREPRPARVRRPHDEGQGWPAALLQALGKRFPRKSTAGRADAGGPGSGALSRESRRGRSCPPSADARSHHGPRRRAARAGAGSRDPLPTRPVRTCVPHADVGARGHRSRGRVGRDLRALRRGCPGPRYLRRELPARAAARGA